MKNILAAMTALMLVPSMTLASSVRPGSRVTHKSLNSGSISRSKSPLCLNEKEKFAEKCDIVIDETGVQGPEGHITNVVQWTTEEKDFNYGGALVGGAAGASAGFAAGLGSCMVLGPFCLITAPTLMGAGMGGGAELGGKGTGRFFTVVGDDAQGNRLIQEFYITSGKAVRIESKKLLKATGLAEGEVKG
jgi:hypothetical protein